MKKITGIFFAGLIGVSGTQTMASIAEYNANYGMAMVGIRTAHNAGYKGQGVIIGVIDGGVRTTHQEFQTSSGSKIITRYDMGVAGSGNSGHGTHVAGIIAANLDDQGTVGYAPEAQLITATVFDSNGDGAVDPDQAIRWMASTNAQILNNSWGIVDSGDNTIQITSVTKAWINSKYDIDAYRLAVSNGKIVVFAAGNSGYANVGVEAGLPYYFPELKPLWVAVVAVDETGNIASYSERCGVASGWCIAAPGGSAATKVLSTTATSDTSYGYTYGTSMSTPVVSATLGVVWGRYPFLSGAQVVEVIFGTATKNAGGVDYTNTAVYGHGLLNAAAAYKGPGELFSDWTVDTKGYTAEFENDISGNYKFKKTGAGTLYLSGQNTYTGKTTVEEGSLMLKNGKISSNVDVAASGIFGGVGTVSQTITNNGTVYVTQTLSAQNYTQSNAGTLMIDGAGSLLSVTNTASLNGYLKIANALPLGTHTFLTAGSVSGTFHFDPNDYAFMNPTINYTPTSINITVSDIQRFSSLSGMDTNQTHVAEALDDLAAVNASDPHITHLQALSGEAAAEAFSEIAGTIVPNTMQMALPAFNRVRTTVYGQLTQQMKGPKKTVMNERRNDLAQNTYYRATDIPLYKEDNSMYRQRRKSVVSKYAPSVWGQAFFGEGKYKKDESTGTVTDDMTGGVVGLDKFISKETKLGLMLSYATGDVKEEKTAAKTQSDTFMGGLYLSHMQETYDVIGTISIFYQDNTVKRTLQTFNEGAKGAFKSYGIFGDIEPALRYKVDDYGIARLSVGVTGGYVQQKAYSETGDAGILLLDVDESSNGFLEARAGAGLDGLSGNGRIGWNLQGYVKWRAVGRQPESTATFQGSTVSFDVEATDIAPVVLNVGAGVSYALNRRADIGAQGWVDIGDKEFSYMAGGYLKIRF